MNIDETSIETIVETSIPILFKLDSPMFNRLYYSNVQVNQLVKLLHNPLSLVNPFRKLLMKYDNQTKYLNIFQVIRPNDKCKIYLKLNNIVSRVDSNNTQSNLVDNVIVNVQEVVSQFQEFMLSSYSIKLENYSIISNYINTIITFDNYYTSVSTIYNLVVDFISAKRYNYIMFDLTIYPLVETVTIPLINQSESKNNHKFRYYLKSSINSNESNVTLAQRELSCLICYIDNCKPLVIQLNPTETLNIQPQLTIIPTADDDIITRLMTTIKEVMVIEDYEDELISYLSDYYDKHQTYIGCKYDIQLIKHILTSILLG